MLKNEQEPSDLDSEILRCIEKALDQYGNTISTAIFYQFSFQNDLDQNDIPSNPLLLEESIRTLFGRGSRLLVQNIVREMIKNFHLIPDDSIDLKTTIELVREKRRVAKS